MTSTGTVLEKCRLCLQPKVLRSSHIIPEFLYNPGYDQKHRLIKLELGFPKKQYQQKGLRESLLCDECEQRLNRNYEQAFLRIWEQMLPRPAVKPEYVIENLPYKEFKLFHLSILWRAGVAQKAPFLRVNLGHKHEEALRLMLLRNTPGGPMLYPILCALLVNPDTRMPIEGTIMSPISKRVDGHKSYVFIFGGCAWRYVVSSHPITNLSHRILSPSGSMRVEVISMMDFAPFDSAMRDHVRRIKEKGNKRQSPGS